MSARSATIPRNATVGQNGGSPHSPLNLAGAPGRPRREPSRDSRKLRNRGCRLRGFLRPPLLSVGELALQALVLGLQGLDVGFEDVQTRRLVDGRAWRSA